MNILVFGDSIVYGAWDDEGGWVARLRTSIDRKILSDSENIDDVVMYNLGVSGDNTLDVLNRFQSETDARAEKEGKNGIIFAVGVNDSQFVIDQAVHRVPLEEFTSNIHQLIEKARAVTSSIIFVGLFPVDDKRVDPIPWAPAKAYRQAFIQQYHQTLKDICHEENIEFLDTLAILSAMDYSTLLEDGVHPNNQGHQLLFEQIRDRLVSIKWI